MMKVDLLRVEPSRPAVARAIGNDDAMVGGERGDLPIERIDLVAPAAVQDHDRRPVAGIAIMNADRRHAGRERDEARSTIRHEAYAKVSRVKS